MSAASGAGRTAENPRRGRDRDLDRDRGQDRGRGGDLGGAAAGPGAEDPLYERLKVFEGEPAVSGGVGKDLVNEPMIRHWCEAMGDTSPAYRGPDAIAPPTMLQAWTMGGLSGHDTGRATAFAELFALLDEAGCTSVVATDCEQEYLRDLRPGGRITFDSVIESISPRKTTKLGTGYFVTTRTDIHADGALAGTHRFRVLKYAPAARDRQPDTGTGAELTAAAELAPEPPPRRPRPVVNRDNAGFWEGVARHELLIQRCTACATLRMPWLPGCNSCGGLDWDTVAASGQGTVYSRVVMHHPRFPAFQEPGPDGRPGPYAVALIELAEGVRMISNVVGVPPAEVRIGMPVRLVFRRYDEELELPVFEEASA